MGFQGHSTPAPANQVHNLLPAQFPDELRRQIETAVEQMLTAAHRLMEELDAHTADADLEPELGAPDRALAHQVTLDQRYWAMGQDAEPSLAMPNAHNDWPSGTDDDREDQHDGSEPSLGSLEAAQRLIITKRDAGGYAIEMAVSDPLDQSRWAWGDQRDLETACEDEGGQCDDEGQPDQEGVPNYASHHDQRVPQPVGRGVY